MKTKEKEILSPVCCFGNDGTEEVHVLKEECPIKREIGSTFLKDWKTGNLVEHCTCIYKSGFDGMTVVKPCEYYKGFKRVTRNKRREYKVLCSALEKK